MCEVLRLYLEGSGEHTQETLAVALGVRQATISRWKDGVVTRSFIPRMSKETNIPRIDLLWDVLNPETT